jgi:hypothetical protein
MRMLPDMRGKGRGESGDADPPCGGTGTYEVATVERCFGWFGQALPKCTQTHKEDQGRGEEGP